MAGNDLFTGSIVAIVTPFRGGELDLDAFAALVEWHVAEGTNGIVVSGTTGEVPTLTAEEDLKLIRVARSAANGRVPIIAGAGSNCTATAIAASRGAESAGADGLLVVNPYYNKPTQAGLVAHYRAIGDAVGLPICLYSVPSRTSGEIGVDTVATLAEHPRIVALKEAGGNAERVSAIRQKTSMTILSGDDPLTLPMMALGARGVISVAANVVPALVSNMVAAALSGDFRTALELNDRLYPLAKALFIETNPIPTKAALALMGKIEDELRLPLVPLSDANRPLIAALVGDYGLLS